jgi:hypothetical protein
VQLGVEVPEVLREPAEFGRVDDGLGHVRCPFNRWASVRARPAEKEEECPGLGTAIAMDREGDVCLHPA